MVWNFSGGGLVGRVRREDHGKIEVESLSLY